METYWIILAVGFGLMLLAFVLAAVFGRKAAGTTRAGSSTGGSLSLRGWPLAATIVLSLMVIAGVVKKFRGNDVNVAVEQHLREKPQPPVGVTVPLRLHAADGMEVPDPDDLENEDELVRIGTPDGYNDFHPRYLYFEGCENCPESFMYRFKRKDVAGSNGGFTKPVQWSRGDGPIMADPDTQWAEFWAPKEICGANGAMVRYKVVEGPPRIAARRGP